MRDTMDSPEYLKCANCGVEDAESDSNFCSKCNSEIEGEDKDTAL